MRRLTLALVLNALLAAPVFAQTAITVLGGVTVQKQSTFMLMGDIGGRVDFEPWVQTFGNTTQLGGDLIVIPKSVGFVVGANTNPGGAHAGVAFNLVHLQVRLMRHTSGAWQAVVYTNLNLSQTWYIQFWAAPATQNGSNYLIGLGYNLK